MKVSISILAVLAALALAACGSPAQARLQLEITSPSSRVETADPELTVTGIISDSGATIKINGESTPIGSDGAFSHTVALPYGASRITIAAEKAGATTANRTINVTRRLMLNVDAPEAISQVQEDRVTVQGTISDHAARIYVTGRQIDVGPDGTFSTIVPLHYLETVIRVSAVLEGMDPLYTLLTVTRIN